MLESEIIARIRVEFLELSRLKIQGYHLSFETVCNWLGEENMFEKYNNVRSTRQSFKRKYMENEKFSLTEGVDKNDKKGHYIMVEIEGKLFPQFSTKGFKMFCMVSNTKKSLMVCEYYIELEEEFLEALTNSEEQNKIIEDKLNNDVKKFTKELKNKDEIISRIHEDRDKYLTQTLNFKEYVKKIAMFRDIQQNKDDAFLEYGNLEYKELTYFRELYTVKTPIYVVNPDIVNAAAEKALKKTSKKKPKAVVDSDSDEHEEPVLENDTCYNYGLKYEDDYGNEKKFDEYTMYDCAPDHESGDESPMLYYYIGSLGKNDPANFNKIGDMYTLKKNHLKSIKDALNTDDLNYDTYKYKTFKPNVFQISYTGLMDIRLKTIERLLCEMIKLPVDQEKSDISQL